MSRITLFTVVNALKVKRRVVWIIEASICFSSFKCVHSIIRLRLPEDNEEATSMYTYVM